MIKQLKELYSRGVALCMYVYIVSIDIKMFIMIRSTDVCHIYLCQYVILYANSTEIINYLVIKFNVGRNIRIRTSLFLWRSCAEKTVSASVFV